MCRFIGMAISATLFLAGPAQAHNATRKDGDDTESVLDIRSASFAHGDNKLRLTLRTREAWKPRKLKGKANWMTFWLDTSKDDTFVVSIDFRNGKLRGRISEPGEVGKVVGKAKVSKLSGKVVRAVVGRSKVKANNKWVKWLAISQWKGTRKCPNGCLDYVPGGTQYSGRIKHYL